MTSATETAPVVRTSTGLRVVARPASTGLVAVAICVGAGSRRDPAGKEGLAHLVEHCTYRSDESQGGAHGSRAHSGALTASGALFGAATYPDTTDYFASARPEALERVLRTEGERVAHIAFDATTLTHERNAIAEELAARAGSRVMDDLWVQHLRAQGAEGAWHDGYGTPESLARIDHEDVALFHRAHYGAGDVVVAIEAPDPERAADAATAAFASIPAGAPSEGFATAASSGPVAVTAPLAGGSAASVSARLSAVDDPARYAAHLVLAALLPTWGVSLAVGRHGIFSTADPDLALAVTAGATDDEARTRLATVLDAVATGAVDAAIPAARTRAGIENALARDTPLARTRLLARVVALHDAPDLITRVERAIPACTPERVRTAAATLKEALV